MASGYSVSHEISIRDTGHTVELVNSYAAKLSYRYHSLRCTTCGKNILAAAISSPAICFLRFWVPIVFANLFPLFVIAAIVMESVYAADHVGKLAALIPCAIFALFGIVVL